jgi:type IV pilus assembly protein PilC
MVAEQPRVKQKYEDVDMQVSKPTVKLWRKISDLSVAFAVRHISVMLKSGITIDGAIKILAEQTTDAKLKKVFSAILIDVQDGISLADAMSKYPKAFSRTITSIIAVGEKGGTLEANLKFLADYLKKNHELQSKLKGAMLYPIIILSLTMAEMLGVVFFILPRLESLFTGFANIPEYTLFIMNASRYIREHGLEVTGVLILLIILIQSFLSTKAGQGFKDHALLRIPILGKLFRFNLLMQFARTMNILMENGIPIERALGISSETINNAVYSNVLKIIHTSVKDGMNLADSLSKYPKLFPQTFIKLIEIGEETGTLSENLNYLYEFYSEDVQEMSTNLTALLEPLLLIFIGAMIGGLAIMIIGPIYQLTSTINA